jgi:hypothetical protein
MLFPPFSSGELASPTGGEHQSVTHLRATRFCREKKINTEHTEITERFEAA